MRQRFFISGLFLLAIFFSLTAGAVNFNFTDTEGQKHSLSEYKGQWVLVNFWATWCPPCRHEIPDLSDYHLEHDDTVVIGVNYEPGLKQEKLKKFIAVYLITYPVTRVNKEIISALGEPRGLPTSILISPKGDIAKRITGMVDEKRINKIITQYSQIKSQIKSQLKNNPDNNDNK